MGIWDLKNQGIREFQILEILDLGKIGIWDHGIWYLTIWDLGNLGSWKFEVLAYWYLGNLESLEFGILEILDLGNLQLQY